MEMATHGSVSRICAIGWKYQMHGMMSFAGASWDEALLTRNQIILTSMFATVPGGVARSIHCSR